MRCPLTLAGKPSLCRRRPKFLQAFAQAVGKEVAGGMRVADLQDTEGLAAALCDGLSFFIQGEAAALP